MLKKILILIVALIFVSGKVNKCGIVKSDIKADLSPGVKSSDIGLWPWLVAVFEKKNSNFLCSGSLINEWTILTAAHCFYNENEEKYMSHLQIKAIVGHHKITEKSESIGVTKNLTKIKYHPEFSSKKRKSEADLAILITATEVVFTKNIQPICLPYYFEKIKEIEGIVAGYGPINSTQSQQSEDKVKYSMLRIENEVNCYRENQYSSNVLSEKSFCAKGRKSLVCRGDSGGGFYIQKGNEFLIIGVTSHSFESRCKMGLSIVFAGVSYFIDWMAKEAKGNLTFYNNIKCGNGDLIPDGFKCDGKKNCEDNSDENFCIIGTLAQESKQFKAESNVKVSHDNFTIQSLKNEKVESFEIFDNLNVKYLPIRLSEKFPNLLSYRVMYCDINTIKIDNFHNLNKLQSLILSENWIETIDSDAFNYLKNLQNISLSYNSLKIFDNSWFRYTKNLKNIDMISNKIKFISSSSFDTLPLLEFVNFEFNQIKVLDSGTFEGKNKLRMIFLTGNMIEKINEGAFRNLPSASIIDLSLNTCINKLFFLNITSLNEVKCQII